MGYFFGAQMTRFSIDGAKEMMWHAKPVQVYPANTSTFLISSVGSTMIFNPEYQENNTL